MRTISSWFVEQQNCAKSDKQQTSTAIMEISLQWLSTERILDSCFRFHNLVFLRLPCSSVCSPCCRRLKRGKSKLFWGIWLCERRCFCLIRKTVKYLQIEKYLNAICYLGFSLFSSASSALLRYMNDSFADERQFRQL